MKLPLILLLILSLTLPTLAAPKKIRITTPISFPRKTVAKKLLVIPKQNPPKTIYPLPGNRLYSVDYLETPLDQIIADLRERFKINIIVYWPQMIQAGYFQDDFLTLQLNHVSAEAIIDSLLNLASAGNQEKLGYEINRNILTINLKQYLPKKEVVVVYYVGDLMQKRSDTLDSELAIGQNSGSRFQSNRPNN
jgi:hypothetical protein